MIQDAPVKRLLRGIQADLTDYRALRDLLETQFDKALRHNTAGLAEVGERIDTMCGVLSARQRERLALLDGASPGQAAEASAAGRMEGVFDELPLALRTLSKSAWHELLGLVQECKALNVRNCALIVEQHETMQRVLGAETDVYVPR